MTTFGQSPKPDRISSSRKRIFDQTYAWRGSDWRSLVRRPYTAPSVTAISTGRPVLPGRERSARAF